MINTGNLDESVVIIINNMKKYRDKISLNSKPTIQSYNNGTSIPPVVNNSKDLDNTNKLFFPIGKHNGVYV